jgi:hypothetical protein
MSEYRRPSQGHVRSTKVPIFVSGEQVDRLLAPKVQSPRRRFSVSNIVSEMEDLLVDPTMRAVAIAAVAGAGIFGFLEWNKDTSTRTISQVTPIERVVERPSVPSIPYTGEYSSTTVGKGMELEVDGRAVVSGDVVVVVNGREVPTFDNNSKTGEIVLTDRPTRIIFPYGGQIEFSRPEDYSDLVAKKAESMKKTGCVNGCEIVHVHNGGSLDVPSNQSNSLRRRS